MQADQGLRLSGRVERVLAMRSFPGLSDVDPKHLAVLADVARERAFARGTTVFSPGSPVRSMHLIRSGEFSVLRDGVVRRRYGPGAIVGGIGALTNDPRGQHVVASAESRTFEIDRTDFADVLEESFPLLQSALRGMLRAALETRLSIPDNAGFSEPIGETTRPMIEFGLVERAVFLRRLMTYGSARVEALAELARDMVVVRAPAGTVLFGLGDPAPHSLLLYSGVVAGETAKGQKFRLGPDSVVGGVDSIAGEARWYRAVAETDVVALRGETEHLIDVLEDHPDMGLDMVRAAARILADLQEIADRGAE